MDLSFKKIEEYLQEADSLHIEVVYNNTGYERGTETQAKFIYHFTVGDENKTLTSVSYLNDGNYQRHVAEALNARETMKSNGKLSIIDNVNGKEYDTFL